MLNNQIVAPTNCPSCGTVLRRDNDQLFCPNNTDCPAQTNKRIQNFCKVLKIKGFGEATLAKLGFSTINDLVDYDESHYIEAGFSENMATKLVGELESRLERKIDLGEFISALSIPLIGSSAAAKLKVSSVDDLESFELLKELGLGEKAATNLSTWVTNEWPLYKDTWEQHIIIKSQTPDVSSQEKRGTVVITGKLNDFKNRADAATYLEGLGFEVKTAVSKTTDYLICEDGTRGSSYTKALNNNITILTIKELEDKFYNE